jgi:methylmalonyl-CoA/ethylmalonyl-CoA epimerase
MITKIDHIGIAVENLETASKYYQEVLGLEFEKLETVEEQKVKTAFFKVGDIHIELLEATDAASPIAKFIDKNGEGIHHLAFYTDAIENQLQKLDAQGIRLIHEVPIEGAGGKQVAFLHPKSTHSVLTELCSTKN